MPSARKSNASSAPTATRAETENAWVAGFTSVASNQLLCVCQVTSRPRRARVTHNLSQANQTPPRGRLPRGAGRDALCEALVRVVARDGLDAVTFRSVAA